MWLIGYKTTTNTIQQVTGDTQSIQGIGKLPYILNYFLHIKQRTIYAE